MSEIHTNSNRPTSASNPGTANSKNNGKAAIPDPQKQCTTRSAPDTAKAMDMKRVDHAVEGVLEKVEEILTAVCALTAPDKTSDELADNMQVVAVRLTRTVDEQAMVLTTSVERLEEELQSVVQHMQIRADVEDVPISTQDPLAMSGPTAKVLKSYTVAAAQQHW
ncbi:hypothetical protein B0H14DRAFT_2612099 [Mycena olivaceomarginata]|nr:hypothetical protein B0H14DRAFT_2612099 [Mycena olivaceomarginata]